MEDLKEWLINSVKISNHEVFKDSVCTDVCIELWGHDQVSLLSDLNKVEFKLNTPNGNKTVKALVKVEPSKEAGRQLAEEWEVFDGEMMMYNDVLKSMEPLFFQAGELELPWPQCYYCADNRILLQNLCEDGYKAEPLYKLLEPKHMTYVMKAIGKFHGISMIMNERGLLDKSKIKPSYHADNKPLMVNYIKLTYKHIAKHIEETWGPEWSDAVKMMTYLAESPGNALQNEVEKSKGNWDVLNHGDFCMRNMLFHYPEGTSRPDGVKFVDFQICCYNSLGLDLVNILYTSLLPSARDQNMDSLLKMYLESLKSICDSHSYSGKLPTLEDIKSCMESLPHLSTMWSLAFCISFYLNSKEQKMHKEVEDMAKKFKSDLLDDESASQVLNENEEDIYNIEHISEALKYEITRLMNGNYFKLN